MRSAIVRASRPARAPARARAVEMLYPESDGKPMAETDVHRNIIIYLIEALKLWYSDHPNVYVSGDLMMYYVEGDANLSVCPDVFVVKGVESHLRRVYKLWEERKAPCVIIEVSSRRTKLEDLRWKFELYRDLMKVSEYYVYDPLKEYAQARLRAWRLSGNRYVERRFLGGRIRSRELGLVLQDTGETLLLVDPTTSRPLPDLRQAESARSRAEAEKTQAEAGRARLEAEKAQVEAEKTRAEFGRSKAEIEKLQAEIEKARAEAEKAQADADKAKAQAELERSAKEIRELRDELEKLRRKHST